MMNHTEIKQFLDEKVILYNRPSFIETDPIQVPKKFSGKENIEISAFFTATLSWGQRITIIRNAEKLMAFMDRQPHTFILNSTESDLAIFDEFKHRTYNGIDCRFFVQSLKNIYQNHGGLEAVFTKGFQLQGSIKSALSYFYSIFFEVGEGGRTRKHVSNVLAGSSAKRLNMFLRWMVREDNAGIDFDLWKRIPASALMLPLDVHTGSVARKLGLLKRKQNDWKAVEEVTSRLCNFDPEDPVKYDFALFGLGVFEQF